MKCEFKVGDIVKCISTNSMDKKCKNKIGKIVYIDIFKVLSYYVKFFEHVDGHTGGGRCKDGYCRILYKHEIKLHTSILKLFLREKNNEL